MASTHINENSKYFVLRTDMLYVTLQPEGLLCYYIASNSLTLPQNLFLIHVVLTVHKSLFAYSFPFHWTGLEYSILKMSGLVLYMSLFVQYYYFSFAKRIHESLFIVNIVHLAKLQTISNSRSSTKCCLYHLKTLQSTQTLKMIML